MILIKFSFYRLYSILIIKDQRNYNYFKEITILIVRDVFYFINFFILFMI